MSVNYIEKIRLNAINTLLMTIGENPVTDLADFDVLQETVNAASVLDEVTLAVLSEGWDFNTDLKYSFPLDKAGYIPVPYNVLDISSDDGDIIMRNWRLYSKSNQSAKFEDAVDVDVLWSMPFEELTHPIRHYITIRSARIFTARTIGDASSYSFTTADEESAMYAARASESRTGKFNILDNMTVNRIWA